MQGAGRAVRTVTGIGKLQSRRLTQEYIVLTVRDPRGRQEGGQLIPLLRFLASLMHSFFFEAISEGLSGGGLDRSPRPFLGPREAGNARSSVDNSVNPLYCSTIQIHSMGAQ